MSSLTTFVDCPNIQDRLEDVFCQSGGSESLPLIGFLFSAENNGSVLARNMIQGSRIKTVELVYNRRVLESEVDDYINYDTCTTSNVRGETSETYTFDENQGVEIAKRFNFIDLARRCESDEMYFTRLLADIVDGAERKMETQAAESLVANTGGFSSIDTNGVAAGVKSVATLLSGGGTDYDAHEQIMESMRFNQFCSNPIVMGDYEIVRYYERIAIGCCADTGLDFSAITNGPLILPSYRIGTAFADTSKFIVAEAGAALPVWYTEYSQDLAARLSDDAHQYTTVLSRRGIPFDVSVIRDCDHVDVKVKLAWDLFYKPTTLYENSDILDGVTGILEFDVVNP